MAWSVWQRLRGTFSASSRAILRSACSTASRATSIVKSWRTSSSVRRSTDIASPPGDSLQELLQPVEAAVDLLAAGRERQPHEPLGPERRARHDADVRRLQGRLAEARRVGHLAAAERPAER